MIMNKSWMDTLGAGSRVFVLDAGYNAEAGTLAPVEARNFTNDPMGWDCRHGQVVAELIAGRLPTDPGVAPECDLYVAKVWDGKSTNWSQYEAALLWAYENHADVVNMSFAAFEISGTMKRLLQLLDEQGCICVASYAGPRWPGASPSCIAVGPLGVEVPRGVLRVAEMHKRLSGGMLEPAAQASYATAVVSGVAACAKAWDKGVNRQGFRRALGDTPDR